MFNVDEENLKVIKMVKLLGKSLFGEVPCVSVVTKKDLCNGEKCFLPQSTLQKKP